MVLEHPMLRGLVYGQGMTGWGLGLLAAVVLALIVLAVLRHIRRGAADAREAARHLGLRVEEVVRDVPTGPEGKLEPRRIVKYSLQRLAPGAPRWALLQRRHTAAGVESWKGWQLVVVHEQISERLRAALARITADWTEEYLEIEATASEIAAYWEEWGGAEQSRRIHGYLQQISEVEGH